MTHESLTTRFAAVALAAATLASCSEGEQGTVVDDRSGSNSQPAPPQSREPEPESSEPEQTYFAEFGDTYEWEDGIAIQVSNLQEFEPSATGAYAKGPHYIKFTLKVVNGTQRPYDAASNYYATLQSGNREAESIFDTARGLKGTPSTAVLPGREVRWEEGYTVKDPADLVYQVQPSFDHEATYFVTKAGG